MTTIARFLGVEANSEDRVSKSEQLDQAAFEIMNFCKAEDGRLCWFYPGTSFCYFLMLIEPPYFTEVTFIGYLVM